LCPRYQYLAAPLKLICRTAHCDRTITVHRRTASLFPIIDDTHVTCDPATAGYHNNQQDKGVESRSRHCK